ncbi:acyl CoA binding protein-domain-containing protein [Aspergillus stella-maris]|uniref:acyl CoA binding protein-domain-containing protein n=1 Tax=Aspergillus stella-maris TaxID=1810926 RepID=UPI003CCE2513
MSAVPSFTSALAAAQGKEKFSPAVQTAAGKVNADALKAALDAVLAGGDDASVADADQSAALKAGFEFATELVKMLKSEPGNDDKLKLYAFFKRSRDEEPAQPSFYQIESKYKYNAWKEISHISQQRAQAQYIEKVNALIDSIGTQ